MPRRELLLAIVAGLALGLGLAGFGSAAELEPTSQPPPIAEAGGGEDENADPFHVSGGQLAVAVLLPLFFVGGTLATFIWAIRNRRRREEEGWEMPWWRTRRWYSHEEEEEA